MKRSCISVLASVMCLCILFSTVAFAGGKVQTSAPDASKLKDGTLIYEETFDGITANDTDAALKAIGWTKVEKLTKFTAKMTISGGVLHIDNLAADSNDSYALMMDDDWLKNVCNRDYTYEYDVTYLDAGNLTRYVSLLCNYDGNNNYNTVDMRIRGDGYNQVRKVSSWIWYNDKDKCPMRATNENAAITKLFGIKYDANAYGLKGKKITIRVETSIKNGPTVYVNNIMVSDMQDNKDQWNTINHWAMCFKPSKLIAADIDNIRVWTGTTDAPLKPEATTAATPKAAATTAAAAKTATAAKTADASVVIALCAVTSAAACVVIRRKKK